MTMALRELAKNGVFVASVFALLLALVPFALEQIGETTGMFAFPASKTVKGWLSFGRAASPGERSVSARPVDWERLRRDLEEFFDWVEKRDAAVVRCPLPEPRPHPPPPEPEKPERIVWNVPVTGCVAGAPGGRRSAGYVFISGFGHSFGEGDVIAPSETMCGYEIVSVGERSVWFRAFFGDAGDVPANVAGLPELTSADGGAVVCGGRRYGVHDTLRLPSGGELLIESFLPPSGVVFRMVGEDGGADATLLSVVVREKGGE